MSLDLRSSRQLVAGIDVRPPDERWALPITNLDSILTDEERGSLAREPMAEPPEPRSVLRIHARLAQILGKLIQQTTANRPLKVARSD